MLNEVNEAGGTVPLQRGAQSWRAERGLRSPGIFARWPLLALLLVILGLAAFGVFAFNVQTNGPLVREDVAIANTLHEAARSSPPLVRNLMFFGYYLGQHFIVAIGVLLAIYFIRRRFWPELAMVVIAWAGEGSLWLVLSSYFDRSRPVFDDPIWHTLDVPGFPSGHTISAVMCYGLLAYLIAPRIRSTWGKAVVVALAALAVFLIGFSRVFVGHHYLTDVLAGLALGIAWSSLVYAGVELVTRARTKTRPRPSEY